MVFEAGQIKHVENWNPTPQSGSIIYNTDNGAWGEGSQYDLKAASGTYTQSWTFGTNEDWGTLAAAFGQLLAGLSRINNAEQLQSSDNVILTAHAGAPITVNDSAHIQTAENVVLIQHYSIIVNGAVQVQTVDNVVLSAHYAIISQNVAHAQTADNIVLTQHQVLAVNTATQLQNADNVALTQHQVLAVNTATQLQTADNVTLTQHQVLGVNTTLSDVCNCVAVLTTNT